MRLQTARVTSGRLALWSLTVVALVAASIGAPPLPVRPAAAAEPACDRAQVLLAFEHSGTAVRPEAEKALLGSASQVCAFLETVWPQRARVDDRISVNQMMAAGGPAVRAAAQVALDSTDSAALGAFLESGWRQPWEIDQRVRVNQIMSTGGTQLRAAAQKALDAGTEDAYRTFLDSGWRTPWQTDQRLRVNQLMAAGGPEVKAAAQRALDLGTPTALTQFIDSEWAVATARDEETATISDLVNAATAAGQQAARETDAAQEAGERAARAAEEARASAQAAAQATAAAKNDANAAAAAAKQAAIAAGNAARAARTAVSAAQDAAHAARQASNAAARAAWAAAMAGKAASAAYRAASNAATDATKAADARRAAEAANAIADKAADSAVAAEQAGTAARKAGTAAQAAANAGTAANAAAAAALESGDYAVQAGADASEARAAAAKARAAADRATRAAQSAVRFAAAAATAADASRDAARRAADNARAAARAANDAADHAGDAAVAAAQATAHANAASAAALAASDAANQAKTVYDEARTADADRIQIAFEQADEAAIDATAAEAQQQEQARRDMDQAAQRGAETNRLIAEAVNPATPAATAVLDARKVALTLLASSGTWSREAAKQALSGDDDMAMNFVRTDLAVAAGQDDRITAGTIAVNGDTAGLRQAATAALAGTDADVARFLNSKDYPGRLTDDRIKVNQIMAAARTAGHGTVVQRAQAALDSNDGAQLRQIIDRGQYEALVVDDRIAINRILSDPASGPELKAAAQVALDAPRAAAHEFLATGRFSAAQADQDSAKHDAVVSALVEQAFRVATTALQDAQEAQAVAATARHDAQQAAGYAQQAANSANLASGYAQQAKASADSAAASAARAAAAAVTAKQAAASANASAESAAVSAAQATLSEQQAVSSAARAYRYAAEAMASAIQAGKDRDAAIAAANAAIRTYVDKAKGEYEETVRQRDEQCAADFENSRAGYRLCSYLITNPVDDFAKMLYREWKNGPTCEKLHPQVRFDYQPNTSAGYTSCVANGPGDGWEVKALGYTPGLELLGEGIQHIADKYHLNWVVVASGLGILTAVGLAALPELTISCAAVCQVALDATMPAVAPSLIGALDTSVFLTLYGIRAGGVVSAVGGAAVGLESVRFAGFLEREAIAARASQSAIERMILQLKGCVNSFTPETRVLMADGSDKPIVDVARGDHVLSTDPAVGGVAPDTVTATHRNLDVAMTDLLVSGVGGRSETIHTTDGHPFWVSTSHRWTEAALLSPGDVLATPSGAAVRVEEVERFSLPRYMYNLSVSDNETYYVLAGTVPVLVHNTSCWAGKGGPGTWGVVAESMSASAAAYQVRVTGVPFGFGYEVNGVKFDGFRDGVLLDAKGLGYAKFAKDGRFVSWYDGADGLVGQAQRQLKAAGGTPITWLVAEADAVTAMRNLFADRGISGINLVHTP
ncbi:polymorphic toxin-type HINT domain-containing protein [Micromonospora sp. RB23]